MGAKAGSAGRRGNRRRTKSRSSPRTCRPSSPKPMRAAARKAWRMGASRLRSATRLSSPRCGSRRKPSGRSSRSTNTCEFEGAIRSGFRQIENNVGAAVTRILAPFLSEQVVKRAVDELREAVARLSAGGSPGLIKIRGPERMLALLRERIADLPIEVEYVEDEGVRNRRRGQRHANRDRASPLGRAAGFVRGLSRADDRATSGNHHRQAPRLRTRTSITAAPGRSPSPIS